MFPRLQGVTSPRLKARACPHPAIWHTALRKSVSEGVRTDVASDVEDEDTASEQDDDSGTGAAIALLVALLGFVLSVAFVILRQVLFQA